MDITVNSIEWISARSISKIWLRFFWNIICISLQEMNSAILKVISRIYEFFTVRYPKTSNFFNIWCIINWLSFWSIQQKTVPQLHSPTKYHEYCPHHSKDIFWISVSLSKYLKISEFFLWPILFCFSEIYATRFSKWKSEHAFRILICLY